MIRLPLRLFAFYAASYGAIGCIPYLSVLLRESGLPAATAALALSGIPVGALLGGSFWAWLADTTGAPRAVLRLATLLSVVAAAALAITTNGWAMAGLLLGWTFVRTYSSLADGLVLGLLADERRSYGIIRGVGSVAFLAVAWTGGYLRDGWPRAPLVLAVGLLAIAALLTWTLPEAPPTTRARPGAARALVRGELPFLTVSVLHGVTLVCFDNFWSMHVENLGLPSWYAGTGVALAVIVEVTIMLYGRRLLDALGPTRLVAIAIAAGVLHDALTGTLTHGEALVAVQGLRGVAFGAFWIAGVAWLSERAPASLASSAQALLATSSYGIGYLVCTTIAALILRGGTTADVFYAVGLVDALAGVALLAATRRAAPAPA